jgi:TolA-binding protein
MAGATLDRVLASRRRLRAIRARRIRMWIPIAAVLAVGTTALARSGGLGTFRALWTDRGAATERGAPPVVPAAPAISVPAPERSPLTQASSAQPAEPASLETAAPAPAPASAPPPPRRPDPSVAALASSTASSTALPPPAREAPSPTRTAEADVYERAHRLHFDGADTRAALAAWDDYLSRYPSGVFAPDARYNRAIDLLKMKRYAEARAALQPFADGSFGGYHGADARDLLRSIP